jgi:hypothetical protein
MQYLQSYTIQLQNTQLPVCGTRFHQIKHIVGRLHDSNSPSIIISWNSKESVSEICRASWTFQSQYPFFKSNSKAKNQSEGLNSEFRKL